jgi:GNAT superfamily N-acetyltransferase
MMVRMMGDPDDLEIKPLTVANFDALAGLFGEGGDPQWCWCAFWRVRGSAGSRSEAAENRELLRGLAGRGAVAPGLVATRAGRAVGWVSLAPREGLPRLVHSRVLAPVDDRPVWSIVCFVVSEAERGRGIGGALLAAAVEYAREHGATTVEAYPLGAHGSSPTGTVSMFERAGFEVVATRQATASARPRQIMRRELARAGR